MWLKFLLDLLADESTHFLLAFTVGFLVFWLISTTLYAYLLIVERLILKRLPMGVVYGIAIISLLAGLASALLSHVQLDGFSLWYTTPLDPPMHLQLNDLDTMYKILPYIVMR